MGNEFDVLAQYQWGLLTWLQLVDFMSESAVLADIRDGRLIRRLHGVYRLAGVAETWRQGPMAAYLAVGDLAAAGFCCAGRVRDLPGVPAVRTELIVPDYLRVRLPGVVARQSNFMPQHHFTYVDALRIATVERVIVDMSARLSAERVAQILRAAVRWKMTTYDGVWKVREEMRARGRRRTTVIDQLFEGLIPGLTPGDSEQEYVFVKWIATAGLPAPTQQVWVSTPGGRYRLDAAYEAEKIDLEWDSELHERTPEDVAYDADRDADLTLAGWLVMRASRETDRAKYLRRLRTGLADRAAALPVTYLA